MQTYKTNDESNSTIVLDDVDDMAFDVEAGRDYEFEFLVPYSSAAIGTGIGLAVSCPAAPAYITYGVDIFTAAAAGANTGAFHGTGSASDDTTVSGSVPSSAFVMFARVHGILSNGGNSGQLKLRFRSEVAASAVTIKKGAVGKLYPKPV